MVTGGAGPALAIARGDAGAQRAAAFALCSAAAMRPFTREARFAGMVPLEAARSSALTAALTSAAAPAGASWRATRAFFTSVRRADLAARLREVLLMRWRLRLTADAWLAIG